jgi:hypothetical protein
MSAEDTDLQLPLYDADRQGTAARGAGDLP